MTSLDDLVAIGRDTPAYTTDDDCIECPAVAGEPCGVDCRHRGGEARRAVEKVAAGLPLDELAELMREARAKLPRQSIVPGFACAWLGLQDAAEERGMFPVE